MTLKVEVLSRVPLVAQQKQIQLASLRTRVQSLASSVDWGSDVAMSCGVVCRRSLDPALLRLWGRPAAVALI